VCPYAHYSGHHPHVTATEPKNLSTKSVSVDVLTFCGIAKGDELVDTSFTVVKSDGLVNSYFDLFRDIALTRWLLLLLETFLTNLKAARLLAKNDYSAIYLRDGEPFLFLVMLASLACKDKRWVVSLTGSVVNPPKKSKPSLLLRLHNKAIQFVSSPIWFPLYKLGTSRNTFSFVTQNKDTNSKYDRFMLGILSGKLCCIPLGVDTNLTIISKDEARTRLGIDRDKLVILSFGAPHPGKDIETVIKGLAKLDGIFFLHGGKYCNSIGDSILDLCYKYLSEGSFRVIDRYITEDEKKLFFGAADILALSYTREFASTSSMLWEAAGFGLPVVASNCNSLGSDVKSFKAGYTFLPGDYSSFTQALSNFRKASELEVESMRLGCSKFASYYSLDNWRDSILVLCGAV